MSFRVARVGLLVATCAAFFTACGSGTTSSSPGAPAVTSTPAATVNVIIAPGSVGKGPAAFGVNPLVIQPGTMVTWTNQDTVAHTSTSDTGAWDSGTLNPGQSFSFVFSTVGTFPYHCAIHGAASMSGTIQVSTNPSPSPSPSLSPSPGPSPSASPSPSPTPSPSVSPSPSPSVSPSPVPTVTVTIPVGAVGMGPAAYGVNPLVIASGTTVTWINQDSMTHTATSDSPLWDSGNLATGQTFSWNFPTSGTFPYHCPIHGAASMSGTIQVN